MTAAMNAEQIAERLGAKKAKTGWSARCPAHEDRSPSLSIDEGRDGRTVLHCHAGCALVDVLAAVGLTKADLAPPSSERRGDDVIATYHYTDEAGVPLYDVIRRAGKKFHQRPANGRSGPGSMAGVRRVLYRLPAVLDAVAGGSTVFVVEGEKDADALIAAGYCATTNAQGAGKWSTVAEHARSVLSGADVVVVRDQDEPGHRHAAEVAASLRTVARSVILCEPLAGKDVSDHLAAGHTVAELIEVDDADQADQADQTDTVDTEPDAVDPMVERGDVFVLSGSVDMEVRWGRGHDVLWAQGESLLIAAPTGVGKTTVALQLVEALVGLRADVLGHPVTQSRRVLYLAMDRPKQIKRAMRRRFGDREAGVLHDRLVVRRGPLPTDLAKAPDQLLLMARKYGADVIVVDSLKDACAKLTDDESGSMVNRAIQLCNAEDVDVLVLHHQRKGDGTAAPKTIADVYGSTWITAGAGSVIVLWGEAGSELVELLHLKQPADPVGPLKVEHDHATGLSSVVGGFDALAWLRRQDGGGTVAQAAKAEHGSDQKAGSARWKKTERRLKGLVRDGYATKDEQHIVGAEVRYRAVDTPRGHALVTAPTTHPVDMP